MEHTLLDLLRKYQQKETLLTKEVVQLADFLQSTRDSLPSHYPSCFDEFGNVRASLVDTWNSPTP